MSAEQSPLVAVRMPSMNHERFVVEAVESIFAQGYPNLRVVICDDASTDGNYAKLQELAGASRSFFSRMRSVKES